MAATSQQQHGDSNMATGTQGDKRIQLVGVSVRAAAQSACRSGWNPIAWDQFADTDLQAICPAHRVDWNQPEFLPSWTGTPGSPWIYTGPLENHPELVSQLSRYHELLGNGPAVLEMIRNPFRVHSVLTQHGFLSPTVRHHTPPPANGAWVLKPFRSGGGFHLRVCRNPAKLAKQETGEMGDKGALFWQQFVPGTPCSAVFVGAKHQSRLLGATQQMLGTPPESDSPFRYLGSVGPLRLKRIHDELASLGEVLTREFSLRGIFGVDFVRQGDRVITIEVNPRYPASCEILERALPVRVLDWHVAACRDLAWDHFSRPPDPKKDSSKPTYWGKLILYARNSLRFTAHGSRRLMEKNQQFPWPPWADIPQAEELIPRGHPVLTIFRQTASLVQLRAQLRRICRQPVSETLFRLGRKKGI